jgi:pimeloyl-ACP methyl ester carboxylesterase
MEGAPTTPTQSSPGTACGQAAGLRHGRGLEAYFRNVHKPYGAINDAQWRRLAEPSTRRLPDGRVTPHCDPAMVMWAAWDRLSTPVLVLRGAESDLLEPAVAQQMTERGPRATLVTAPACGHAPALNTTRQFAWVADFFAAP